MGDRRFYFLLCLCVDARLQLVDGQRLSRLRREDLPMVAKAITGYERRLVTSERCYTKQVAYYRFRAIGFHVVVLASDYEKILPYLEDGTLDPLQYPAPQVRSIPGTGVPCVWNIDQWDTAFYQRVHDQLRAIFVESYPTSEL